jgi:chorismate mutase/prephenate dehydratase
MKMNTGEKIKSLRQRIEILDRQMLHLLNERAEVVMEVDREKSEGKMDSYDPQREEEIVRSLVLQNNGPFPKQAIVPVFREIISACRSLETEMTVAYLGPPATHSHVACYEYFGSSVQTQPKESIQEVFEAVEKRKANYGVVPIENSTEGSVNQTLDRLIESEVVIFGEVMIQVSHHLLSHTGRLEDIRKIASHPSALEQCRKWLRKNFPHVEVSEATSTAKAAQMAAEDPKTAAIASSLAAQLYGLKIVESRIEDYLSNYTRFLIIGLRSNPRTGKDKTSILFSISHTPGSLYQALKPFSEKGISLTKIESRPIKGKPWEYIFFVDIEGHAEDAPIREVMVELGRSALFLKVLGSYPQCSLER